MILASWHSVQAVRAFACIVPAGRSAVFADCAHSTPPNPTATMRLAMLLGFHMYIHPIYGVVKVPARIPGSHIRLHTTLTIGCSRHYREIATVGWLPRVTPHAPGVPRLLLAQNRWNPSCPAIGRDFDLHDVGFPRPRDTLDVNSTSFQLRSLARCGDERLHIEGRNRMRVFRIHCAAGRYRLIRHTIAGLHEVSFK